MESGLSYLSLCPFLYTQSHAHLLLTGRTSWPVTRFQVTDPILRCVTPGGKYVEAGAPKCYLCTFLEFINHVVFIRT